MKTALLTSVLCISSASFLAAADAPEPPPCRLPDPNGSQACQDCYDDACYDYLDDRAPCGFLPPFFANACYQQQYQYYLANLTACPCGVAMDDPLLHFAMVMPDRVGALAITLWAG